ncbi:MAG: hypothetical protein QFX33_01605 [Candidatus Nezhaarchaeota archaeon]|nr:hypothetical protein [Candidatus Nezhaarchaeota archaeon]
MYQAFIVVLEAAFVVVVTSLVLLLLYGLSRRATSSFSGRSAERRKPFMCGESVHPSKTGVPDAGVYTTIWKNVFKSIYEALVIKVHTGILSEWLFWMILFMVIMTVVLVMVV